MKHRDAVFLRHLLDAGADRRAIGLPALLVKTASVSALACEAKGSSVASAAAR